MGRPLEAAGLPEGERPGAFNAVVMSLALPDIAVILFMTVCDLRGELERLGRLEMVIASMRSGLAGELEAPVV
jgi:hypothetical protein